MGQLAVKLWLLNKRLFKKYSFWMIMCLVPVLVAGMRLALREESGVAGIAIYRENPRDDLTAEVIRQLTEEKTLLRYVFCETQEEARALVVGGRVNAALIFPRDLQAAIEQAAVGKSVEPVVTVVEREDSVTLVLVREILSSVLYPHYSYEVYKDFVRDDCGLGEVSDGELLESYNETKMDSRLFRIVLLDGTVWEDKGYLLAPVRGMLALWLVLCGLASSLYFMQDELEGTFDRVPLRRRLWTAFGMQAVLLCDGAVILLLALKIGGLFTSWPVEVFSLVLFSCCIAAMSGLLRLLCRTPERLGCAILILLLAMITFSPVFIYVTGWRAVKLLLPSYYYLQSIHDSRYLCGMAIYAVTAAGICVLLDGWRSKYGHAAFRR